MTDRRLAHNPARPAVAGRGPDDLPKCHLRPEWLDALMSASGADEDDHRGRPARVRLVPDAGEVLG